MNREREIALGVECAWTPLPEVAGADGAAMAFGPGHVSGTPLPGEAGNSVIGGHLDTHLAFLAKLKPGDMLIAERADGRRVSYRVSAMEVLDRLTLVTCYPFDAWRAGGSQRYVLVAFLS
jgi:sortase A